MDGSYVLSWLIGLTTAVWLLRSASTLRRVDPSWIGIAVAILVTLGLGLALAPDDAGWIAAGLWAPLFLTPLLLSRIAARLAGRRRFSAAARLARVAAALHPTKAWRRQPRFMEALAAYRIGRDDDGRALLEGLMAIGGAEGSAARLMLLQAEQRWGEIGAALAALGRADPRRLTHLPTLHRYVRALAEIGRPMEAFLVCAAATAARPTRGGPGRWDLDLVLAAFAGREDLVQELISGPLRGHDAVSSALWRGTARLAAGDAAGGLELLTPLRRSDDRLVAAVACRRLDAPPPIPDVAAWPPPAREELRRLEARVAEAAEVGMITRPPARSRPWLTWALVLGLAGVFVAELPGGATSPRNLLEMGALVVPPELLDGQWWRIVTAGLLHFGLTHLLLNAAGLWLFGRWLEARLGRLRLGALYAVSGVGAMALMEVWALAVSSEPGTVVGASASVMGLLGGAIALLWRRRRFPLARRQLQLLVSIAAFQAIFDLMTPLVSGAAHGFGLGLGVLLGLLLDRARIKEEVRPLPAAR